MKAKQPCAYATAHNHSKDRVTVHCGRPEPVVLCGYHASDAWLKTALAAAATR